MKNYPYLQTTRCLLAAGALAFTLFGGGFHAIAAGTDDSSAGATENSTDSQNMESSGGTSEATEGSSAGTSEATEGSSAETDSANTIQLNGVAIAKYTAKNKVRLIPSENGKDNYLRLNALLGRKGNLTIVIPSGSKISVNGTLHPTSNKTIIAKGATITMKAKNGVLMTEPSKKVKNITINGGKWRTADKKGLKGTMFYFANASKITLSNLDASSNFQGHGVRLVSCTNVTIKKCTFRALGSKSKTGRDAQIQIDTAAKNSTPEVAKFGAKYVKGQTCSKITLTGNTIYGACGIAVKYDKNYRNQFHKKINIKNNKIHAVTAEGIAYYNVVGGTISGNTVRTDATQKTDGMLYTCGISILSFGEAPSSMASSTITVKKNTIYGNRNGVFVKAYFTNHDTRCPGKFGTVQIQGNKIYSKMSRAGSVSHIPGSAVNYIDKSNRKYQWKKKTRVAINLRKH